MKIIMDCFGADHSPLENILGCQAAVKEYNVEIILTGDVALLKKIITENKIDDKNFEFAEASSVIEMLDDPMDIIRSKKNSSMGIALELLKNGKGDAMVSGGSTGALLSGATFVVKRIKGIKRAALAGVMPTINAGKHVMLIDSGANVECRAEMLDQFATMGSIYMEKVEKINNPRVGLVNNGAEESKGTELYIQAHKLLKENTSINFIGNVEPRGLMLDECDVMVCDGFVGNMILKSVEGVGKFVSAKLKSMFYENLKTKISGLVMNKQLKAMRKLMDYSEIGGVPLLGIAKPIIKAHGSSNANAYKNAIKQAVLYASSNIIQEIENNVIVNKAGNNDENNE